MTKNSNFVLKCHENTDNYDGLLNNSISSFCLGLQDHAMFDDEHDWEQLVYEVCISFQHRIIVGKYNQCTYTFVNLEDLFVNFTEYCFVAVAEFNTYRN